MTTTLTSVRDARRARVSDALALAPATVRDRAVAAIGSGPSPRFMLVDPLGVTFHASPGDAGEAWLAAHTSPGDGHHMAWIIDIHADGLSLSGARRKGAQ